MTDPGLDQRLRQRSRRAGFMIGISMALTIAVCIGGFSVIYAALDDTFGDFLSREVEAPVVPTEEPTPAEVADNNQPAEPEDTNDEEAPAPTEEEAPTEAPEPTESPDEFVPDYQTSSEFSIRLRSEPSRQGGDATIIRVLPPETPIQFTGTDEPATDPEDGDRWMLFRTEDGDEGWIREIDVNEYEP
jgi:hypothetical protein